MEKYEIDRFTATTFGGNKIEFIVYNDNTIDCLSLEMFNINLIKIKPRFILCSYYQNKFNYYVYKGELIKKFNINEELFKYLKDNNMIMYSNEIATLYNFIDKNGFNKNKYNRGIPYKRKKKKNLIWKELNKDNLTN